MDRSFASRLEGSRRARRSSARVRWLRLGLSLVQKAGPAIVLALAGGGWASAIHAQALRAVALVGDPAPETGGAVYQSLGTPALAGNGHVAFRATLTGGTAFEGIFVDKGNGPEKVVVTGDAFPDASGGVFNGVDEPAINAAGRIAFVGTSNVGATGLFLWSGGAPSAVAMVGDAAPDTNGLVYSSFGFRPLSINVLDEIAFQGTAVEPGSNVGGVWVESPVDSRAVVLDGDPAPGALTGTYLLVGAPSINDAGDVTLPAILRIPGTTQAIVKQVGGVQSVVAKQLDPLPPPLSGLFGGFVIEYAPAIDASGGVVFDGVSGGDGIFRESGGTLELVAFQGDVAPETGGGTFLEFLDKGVGVNAMGEIVFAATIATGTTSDGIFVATPSSLVAVALAGEIAPDAGGATFASFPDRPRINDMGTVAFRAALSGGTAPAGLFAVPEPGPGVGLAAGLLGLGELVASRRPRRSGKAAPARPRGGRLG